MNPSRFCTLLAVALFATATAANAAVHRVFPGESIQDAIDLASPGDTILVEPGEYVEAVDDVNDPDAFAGLRITTPNLRLIGKVKKGQGEAGKVRLIHNTTVLDDEDEFVQRTGVYAAPAGCGPEILKVCLDDDDNPQELQGFYIRGFTVEDFPGNGIQTRFVDDFQIIRNESARNLHNGIYPTISANGLVQNNVSYGSEDTAMWVAASQNVRVIGNEMYDSVIGLEVNVSLNVEVKQNDVHDNTVGIGLFHPNTAGNKPLDVMGNWVVEHNNVYDNNTPNFAPDGSFQQGLPSGVGILVLGVSGNVVGKNNVEGNDFVGIGVVGWCSAASAIPDRDCISDPPVIDFVFYDPSVNDNLVAQNKVRDNGLNPPDPDDPEDPFGGIAFLAADLTYFSFWPFPTPEPEDSSGNCFEKNKPKNGFTISSYDLPPDFGGTNGPLPDDGC